MKRTGRIIITPAMAVAILLVALVSPAGAQTYNAWFNITNDLQQTDTVPNSIQPTISVGQDGYVHIFWTEADENNPNIYQIFYTKLDNSGRTVIEPNMLTTTGDLNTEPTCVANPDGSVHLVWARHITAHNGDLYYAKISTAGLIIAGPTKITAAGAFAYTPELKLGSLGNLHLTWLDGRTGAWQVFYMKLDNSGGVAVADTQVTYATGGHLNPDISPDGQGGAYIAYEYYGFGNPEIYCSRMKADGTFGFFDTRISNTWTNSETPAIATAPDGSLSVIFIDRIPGNYELYYARVEYAGSLLAIPQRMTYQASPSVQPAVVFRPGGDLAIVFTDSRHSSTGELYSLVINIFGTILSSVKRMTVFAGVTDSARIAVDGYGSVHVAWRDTGSGHNDIFYKKGAPGNTGSNGFLQVRTEPVAGHIYIDGSLRAEGGWSGVVSAGAHTVSYGTVTDYVKPVNETVTVAASGGSVVTGIYEEYREWAALSEVQLLSPEGFDASAPAIDANEDGNVAVSAEDDSYGNPEVSAYYLNNIAAPLLTIRQTNNVAESTDPGVLLEDDGALYTVWRDTRASEMIYFEKRDADGSRILGPTAVSSDTTVSSPRVETDDDGNIHIAWIQTATEELWYAKLNSEGVQALAPRKISDAEGLVQSFDMYVADSGEAQFVWGDNRDGNDNLYYASVDNAGDEAAAPMAITATANATLPRIALRTADDDDEILHLVWVDDRGEGFKVYGAGLETDGNVLTPTALGDYDWPAADRNPALASGADGSGYVVWTTEVGGDKRLMFAMLSPLGQLVVTEVEITATDTSLEKPAIVADKTGGLHISWLDGRDGTNKRVAFIKGATAPKNSSYGFLKVTTTNAAGMISVDDDEKLPGTWSGIAQTGSRTVSFEELYGYDTPEDVTETVSQGETVEITGEYTRQYGTLDVATTPVPGGIYVDGDLKATGAYNALLGVASYSITFEPINGYVTPAQQDVELVKDETTSVVAAYISETVAPNLAVATPAEDEVFGTRTITVSGTASDDSGIDRVTVNGYNAVGTENWTYNYQLVAGDNVLNIIAWDLAATPNSTTIVRNVFFDATQDTDGDGMPDWWEEENGLLINNPGDAVLDPDDDGRNNLQEFEDDTDPHNADVTAPVMTSPAAVPNTVRRGQDVLVTMTAIINDAGAGTPGVMGGELFVGADPGVGKGAPLNADDGAFDSTSENVTGLIDVTNWHEVNSPFTVYMRGRDVAGNWGSTVAVQIDVVDGLAPAAPGDFSVEPRDPAVFEELPLVDATATTEADADHGADKLIDDDNATHWTSAPFADAEVNEEILVDMGDLYEVSAYKMTAAPNPLKMPEAFMVKMAANPAGPWTTVIAEGAFRGRAGRESSWWIDRKGTTFRYAKIIMTKFPRDRTRTYTAAIGEIRIERAASTFDSLLLSWAAPGDDGNEGAATLYDVRMRTDEPVTDANWDAAAPVADEPGPQVAGTEQAMDVNNLDADTHYYFGIRAEDENANASAIAAADGSTSGVFIRGINILSPADGSAITIADIPTYDWENTTFTRFTIQFSDNPRFRGSRQFRTTETEYTPTERNWRLIKQTANRGGGTLYWRIMGSGRAGRAYSATYHQFTMEAGLINILSPADNTGIPFINPSAVVFSWEATNPGIVSFQVEINASEEFGRGSITTPRRPQEGLTNWALTGDARDITWRRIKRAANRTGGILWWRIKGLDADGVYQIVSEGRSFYIDIGELTATSPVDVTLPPDTVPTFEWTYAGDALTVFKLEVSADADFANRRNKAFLSPAYKATSPFDPLRSDIFQLQRIMKTAWDARPDGAEQATIWWRVWGRTGDRTFTSASAPVSYTFEQ